MKKKIILGMVLALSLGLYGCDKSDSSKNKDTNKVDGFKVTEIDSSDWIKSHGGFDPNKSPNFYNDLYDGIVDDFVSLCSELDMELSPLEGSDISNQYYRSNSDDKDAKFNETYIKVGTYGDEGFSTDYVSDSTKFIGGIQVYSSCKITKDDVKDFDFRDTALYPIAKLVLGDGNYIEDINMEFSEEDGSGGTYTRYLGDFIRVKMIDGKELEMHIDIY